METEAYSRAVRADGEVIVLHCWLCGTPHYVTIELFSREGLASLACSRKDCGVSMFLANELEMYDEIQRQMVEPERNRSLAARSRFWK